jgi:hypothetical protein
MPGLDALDLADNLPRTPKRNPLLAFHKRGDLVITVRTSTNPEGIERSPSPVKRASSAPLSSMIPLFSGVSVTRKVPEPIEQPDTPLSDRTVFDSPASTPSSTLSRPEDSEANSHRKPKKTVTFHEEVSKFEFEYEEELHNSADSLESLGRDITRKVTI